MRKIVFTYGIIGGLIVAILMSFSMWLCMDQPNFEGSMVLGYTIMLVSMAFIFVGVKRYRDRNLGGVISFGRALATGLLIALVASTFYVISWLIIYYNFMPDFMDRFADIMLNQAKESGMSEVEYNIQVAEMNNMKEMYKNPAFVILFTYFEILPVGILVSLVSALVWKRKTPKVAETE